MSKTTKKDFLSSQNMHAQHNVWKICKWGILYKGELTHTISHIKNRTLLFTDFMSDNTVNNNCFHLIVSLDTYFKWLLQILKNLKSQYKKN